MKRIFALFALLAVAMVGCETEDPNGGQNNNDGKEYVLTLASPSVMKFSAEGGVGEIGYSLTEVTRVSENTKIEVACTVNWISNIVIGESISFQVAPNTGDLREALLKVSYKTQNFSVLVRQEAAGGGKIDVEFTATHLGGTYYGKLQSTGYDYFMILSNMQPMGLQSVPYGATEYRLDLYADKGAAFDDVRRIPVGTYKIDHTRSGAPFTIDAYKDCSYLYDSYGTTTPFADGTVVVSEDGIVATLKLFTGEVHRVVYNGSLEMEDYSEPTFADVYPVSQYTSTITFDVDGGTIMPIFRGDYYDSESDVWFVHMIEQKAGFSGVYLLIDFLVPRSVGGYNNKDGFLGDFSLLDPKAESWDYTFPSGRLRDDSMQLHAWYAYCYSGQLDMSMAAPITAGNIKFEKMDDGKYQITVDGMDDNGNKIEGTFKGAINEYQYQAFDL